MNESRKKITALSDWLIEICKPRATRVGARNHVDLSEDAHTAHVSMFAIHVDLSEDAHTAHVSMFAIHC